MTTFTKLPIINPKANNTRPMMRSGNNIKMNSTTNVGSEVEESKKIPSTKIEGKHFKKYVDSSRETNHIVIIDCSIGSYTGRDSTNRQTMGCVILTCERSLELKGV